VAERAKQLFYFFLVSKTGVIGAERNFHGWSVNWKRAALSRNLFALPNEERRSTKELRMLNDEPSWHRFFVILHWDFVISDEDATSLDMKSLLASVQFL
jgi:hypothetical protein